MRRVLFVDDEVNVLEGLERGLRRHRKQWEMEFVSSGADALRKLEEAAFDVVVSDMLMPGMDGAELLHEVCKLYPRTLRFILSGQSDRGEIMRAVPVTHQFFAKPCQVGDLYEAVTRACKVQDVLRNENLEALVASVDALPVRPTTYVEISKLLTDPLVDPTRVADVVQEDPGLAAKLLQIVNSSFFGMVREIREIDEAVRYLGLDAIRELVLTAEIFAAREDRHPAHFVTEHVETHSLRIARMLRGMCSASPDAKHVFSAGILHDVGLLVMIDHAPDDVAEVARHAVERQIWLHDVERQAWGVSHQEIGAALLGLWGFPLPVIEAAVRHHQPEPADPTGPSLALAIHVAERLVGVHDPGPDGWGNQTPTIGQEEAQRLGISDRLAAWSDLARSICEAPHRR